MIDDKTSDKLDALLKLYYNSASTDGEKSNANALFEKICKKNNIDPDGYKKYSSVNPANERQRGRSSSRYRNSSSGFDVDDFWDFVARAAREAERRNRQARDRANEYRRRYEEADRKRREEEQAKKQQEQSSRWGSNRWGTLEFEMKEPLWEVKIHDQKRVILLNTMVRGKGTQNRWGTQNFCIYSDVFDPEKWFKNKESIYIIHSSKVQYFRDYYIVEKLWIVDSAGFEIEIPLK